MERGVVRLRGYHLATFREYYMTFRLITEHHGIRCGESNPSEMERIYESIRLAHADVIVVGGPDDIDDICKANCGRTLGACPNPGRPEQDKGFLKKYKFEVREEPYDVYEVHRLLGIELDW